MKARPASVSSATGETPAGLVPNARRSNSGFGRREFLRRAVLACGALAGPQVIPRSALDLDGALYLYGPSEDRPVDRSVPTRSPAGGSARSGMRSGARLLALALRPRYRLRRDLLWLALLPAGVLAYGAWLALPGGDALGPVQIGRAHVCTPVTPT